MRYPKHEVVVREDGSFYVIEDTRGPSNPKGDIFGEVAYTYVVRDRRCKTPTAN